MAEALLAGGLVGSVVDKLLTQVLQAASLALQHNKNYEALYTLLSRLQPLVSDICSQADAAGPKSTSTAMHNWLQSLYKELKEAEDVLQASFSTRSTWNVMKKISNSKEILRVTQSIQSLLPEVGLLGLSHNQSVQTAVESGLPELSEQLTSLQQYVHSLELSLSTRNAFLTPTWNYGHAAGTTTLRRAFSQIKQSADAFLSVTSIARDSTTTPVAMPKYRHQDSETMFGGAQTLEGMQRLLLLSQDDDDEGSRRWVGVWATGGAGKTFIAERLFNSPLVQSHFTGGTFWLTVGRSLSLQMLFNALFLECTNHLGPVGLTMEDTKNRLCQELGGRQKAVLFLDDVWDPWLLDWLDVLPNSGNSGNKIFVTTRNVEILERKDAARMRVPMLPVEDSWKLFCWHAFHGDVPAHLEVVARKVVDECQGLPLALKVIGSSFAGKMDLRSWHRSLEKLKNAEILSKEHERQLFLRLELSLQDLPDVHPHLKDCFLYFAAFPENSEVRVVEDLLDIWVGEGIVGSKSQSYTDPEDEAYELVGWLIARSLIDLHSTERKSYMTQSFLTCRVHDVLRDLARYTLQHKQDAPTRECLYEVGRQLTLFPPDWMTSSITTRSLFPFENQLSARRLSLSFNSLAELPQQLHAPNLQVLLLRDNPLLSIPKGFVESLRSLRVLDLRNTNIRDLPSTVGNLKLLVILNLSYCFNLEKIPDSVGKMKGLRRLDISECNKLSSLPSKLSRLTNLQILNLASFKVWDGKGISLSRMLSTMLVLKDLTSLTELTQLNIWSLTQDKFSLTFTSFHKLQLLKIRFRQLTDLPDVKELKALESLVLWGCWTLRSLPPSVTCLTKLTSLDLTACRALCTLPALDLLPQLEKLDLTDCCGLTELPSSFGRAGAFPALRELSMYGCDKVVHFPMLEAGAMSRLALLNLSGWIQLSSLPHSLQQLKNLQTLDASLCTSLQSLDQSLDILSLSSLEELFISRNESLTSLPPALASLPKLKVLDIGRCGASIPLELLQLEGQGKLEIRR